MKKLLASFILLSTMSMFYPYQINAQGSPAFDKDCYFPRMGNPSELDTIYGTGDGNALGAYLTNLGPWLDESYGRIAFYGHPENRTGWTTVNSGPGFNLHNMPARDKMTFVPPGPIIKRGHFRSSQFTDLLVEIDKRYRIYWQDEQGNYDKDRFSALASPVKGAFDVVGDFDHIKAAATDFDNDELLDIVVSISHVWTDPLRDSLYLAFYKGKPNLDTGISLLPDSLRFWFDPRKTDHPSKHRIVQVGNFRGGKFEDVAFANPYGSLFYYRNEGEFSFEKYTHSVLFDTLCAAWQNSGIAFDDNDQAQISFGPSLQVLPKQEWDKSVDLMLHFPTFSCSEGSLSFYRGNADFGTRRIFMDSADDKIYHPCRADEGWSTVFWPGPVEDCGDMSGTGNKVIRVGASALFGFTSMSCFYVVEKAIDSKIDMFIDDEYLVGYGDTITANFDKLQDYVIGHGVYVSWEDHLKGIGDVGTIHVIYGSTRIPVKLNPKYSVDRDTQEQLILQTYPNPATDRINVEFSGSKPITKLALYNPLGQVILERTFSDSEGGWASVLDVHDIASGTYVLELISGAQRITRMVSILR